MLILESDYQKLYEIILNSNNIVFFGGAGVSTESGIPDFRSQTGLYNKENATGYSPEYMLSHEFLIENPEEFSKYYKENLIYEDAKPNITHKVLKKLEEMGKLKAIITQNIDSLHQIAGSTNVLEIHGNLRNYYCMRCGREYPKEEILKTKGANYCDCGGYIRPDVVLYGENLNQQIVKQSINAIAHADVLIIAGTSLVVYPAASFINFYNGNKSILINKEVYRDSSVANYVVEDEMGNFFGGLHDRLQGKEVD